MQLFRQPSGTGVSARLPPRPNEPFLSSRRDGAARVALAAPPLPGQRDRRPHGAKRGAAPPGDRKGAEEDRMRSVAKVASLIALIVLVLAAFALQLAEF